MAVDQMKFEIENIREYDGADLILLIGCPGSRWSNIHSMLSENSQINNTDWSEEKSWESLTEGILGTVHRIGNHTGSYWGPGNMYGKNFGRLDLLSKEEILTEFMDAYETWDKIKVIKSHWFAYNIDYLHNLFPKAKIVSCYAGDLDSFYWWHKCGGWGLGYANYSWYEDDTRLLEKIKEENSNILKFNIDRDIDFKFMLRHELWENVGIPEEAEHDTTYTNCKIAIYSGGHVPHFKHLRNFSRQHLRQKTTESNHEV